MPWVGEEFSMTAMMEVIRAVKCFVHFSPKDRSVVSCAYMRVQPELFEVLKTQQWRDEKLSQILIDIEEFSPLGYTIRSDGILLFWGHICIPSDERLK